MVENQGLKLPYSVMAGSIAGGLRPIRLQGEYEAYGWNPPEYLVPGHVVDAGGWRGFFTIADEARAKPQPYNYELNEYAYRATKPVHEINRIWSEPGKVPAGWKKAPPRFPCYGIGRRVVYVTEEQGFAKPDPDASPKPTWDEILNAQESMIWMETYTAKWDHVRRECKRRITEQYEATSIEHEILRRLRGATTKEQDDERERLRAVCLAEQIKVGEMTVPMLQAYDPADDSIWAKP